MIRVTNLRKEAGAHVDKVDRSSALGNPYKGDRETAIRRTDEWLTGMIASRTLPPAMRDALNHLYRKARTGQEVVLGCWCHPLPCHADVVKRVLEEALARPKPPSR